MAIKKVVKRRTTKDGKIIEEERWRVTVYAGRDAATGKPIVLDTLCSTEKAAKEKERAFLRQVEDRKVVSPSHRMTVAAWCERWLTVIVPSRVKARTLRRYRQLVEQHIIPAIGSRRLDQLTAADVQNMLAALAEKRGPRGKPLSTRTQLHVYRVLHTALEAALKEQRVAVNVCEQVDPPRPNEVLPEGLSVEQVNHLLHTLATFHRATVGGDTYPDPLYPLYATALHTGMRLGELLGLRWQDVDLDRGIAVVRQELVKAGRAPVFDTPKSRKPRVVPLSSEAVAVLQQRRAAAEVDRLVTERSGKKYGDWPGAEEHGPLVFCQENGKPLDPTNLTQRHFKRVIREANRRAEEARNEKALLPKNLRFHDLRHTFVSRALQAGANPRAVSEVVGHYDPGFTLRRYAHALLPDTKEAVERLARSIKPGQAPNGSGQ